MVRYILKILQQAHVGTLCMKWVIQVEEQRPVLGKANNCRYLISVLRQLLSPF